MKTSNPDPTSSRVPAHWSWHYHWLQTLRDRLLENRGAQIAELAKAAESNRVDMDDGGEDEVDHDTALSILSHEQDALYEVDAAIRRILAGSYGICEESGNAIPAARLRAVPWTRYTQEVEKCLEQAGVVSHARS
ncbi:MAG: TraR/DksA family transcriptional regulator [Prosthecobacter sp.]|nr:TraR/DksA family transcriptional regulator [Prosthecobacter sp.]